MPQIKINNKWYEFTGEDDLKNLLYASSSHISILAVIDVVDRVSRAMKENQSLRITTHDGTRVRYEP